MINDAIAKSYEAANYASHAYEQSFITNLHARARLRGLNPKAPNSAKVLEIGCASGGNLIAQALVFKDAHFTGIDLSKAQIKNGKTALEKIGIKNIDLLCLDICDAPAHFGSQKFDYIIAHGVYALHKNDCEAVFMMDGTHSKADIVAHFVELCQKNNAAPSRIIDGKKVLIESKKEQEAYFDEAISTLISDLEAQCMFESIS